MSLRSALEPLLAVDGLVSLLLLTADGLPLEMLGYGLRPEQLAAEVAGVAGSTRRSCRSLGLGEPLSQRVRLGEHYLDIFAVEGHYLALIAQRDRPEEPLSGLDGMLASLGAALRGEA